jgi:predicted phosphodiesterase
MTTTKAIGTFDAPTILCGGAYSNLEALEALFEEAERLQVPPERIIHTGDVIAYCSDHEATARLLAASGAHAIKGNVEEQIGLNAGDCACGFAEGSQCQTLAVDWYAAANAQVTPGTRTWMAGLPDQIIFTMNRRTFRVVHGGVNVINRFMFPSLTDAEFSAELADAGTDCVIAGHTGIPFTRHVDGRIWHNSGALGMPANDGTQRGWFSLLTPMVHCVRIEHRPLHYDHITAARKMRQSGGSPEYAAALETGFWPYLDILPEAERQTRGRRITLGSVFWARIPRSETVS